MTFQESHDSKSLMEKTLGFIGFGSFGQQILSHLKQSSCESFSVTAFDDSNIVPKENEPDITQLTAFLDYQSQDYAHLEFFVSLGYKHLQKRLEIIHWLIENNRKLANFVHPTVTMSSSATLGQGVIIYPGSIIDHNVHIGNGAILNNGVIVSHDSLVGAGSFLAPGVTICGNTKVGECTFLGASTTVSNNVHVGDNCVIGISSLVQTNVSTGIHAIGNPLRILPEDKRIILS